MKNRNPQAHVVQGEPAKGRTPSSSRNTPSGPRRAAAFALLFLVVAFAGDAAASPHPKFKRIVTALPRAWGRTARNMFTFRDPLAAVQQWGQIAAVMMDARSTDVGINQCRCMVELNPFLGKHPSSARIYIEMNFFALNEVATTQFFHEQLDPGRKREQALTFIPLAESGALHGWAASHNWNLLHNVRSGAPLE